jgi:electron transport complex protein RnfA
VLAYAAGVLLLKPLQLEYLNTLTFILVIAVTVQFTEMVLHKTSPALYRVLGIYLPLITTNCIVLGVALLNIRQENPSFIKALLTGLGSGLGFALVLVLFAAMRERIAVSDVPRPFRGSAIALVTAGLISLSFMGFSGLIRF